MIVAPLLLLIFVNSRMLALAQAQLPCLHLVISDSRSRHQSSPQALVEPLPGGFPGTVLAREAPR